MNFKYQGLGTYKRDTGGRFSSLKAAMKRAVRFAIRWSLISAAAYALFMAGAAFYSTSEVKAVTTVVVAPSPVLDRIADCESGARLPNGKATKGSASHFDKNGQVLMRANVMEDGSKNVDIGKYQVNETFWGKKATDLGLDLAKEADNKAMAEWIYANKGTGDWSASQKCWKN